MHRRLTAAVALFAASFIAPIAAHASAPSNDNFANAQPMVTHVEAGNFAGQVDMTDATIEAGEHMPSCGSGNRSIWFRIDNAVEHGVAVTVRSSPGSTVTALWSGNSLPYLSEVTCNSYWHAGSFYSPPSNVLSTWMSTSQTLYLQILANGPSSVSVSSGASATNDDWRFPAAATNTSSYVTSGDLTGFTVQPQQPSASCAPVLHDAWQTFTATSSRMSMWASMAPGQTGSAAVYSVDASGIHNVA